MPMTRSQAATRARQAEGKAPGSSRACAASQTAWPCASSPGRGGLITPSVDQRSAVHTQQRLADELDLDPVGVLEVDGVLGATVGAEVRHALLFQARLG